MQRSVEFVINNVTETVFSGRLLKLQYFQCMNILVIVRKHFTALAVVMFSLIFLLIIIFRSSHPDVFLRKGVLKICSTFTGEHPCRSAISIKLQINFIEITLRHGCSPANFLHIFRTPFLRNTSGRLLLHIV